MIVKPAPGSVTFFEDNIAVMRRYPDGYFDLGIADPPFGIGESSKDHASRNNNIIQRSGNACRVKQSKYEKSDWDKAPPPPEFYIELFRVSKRVIIKGENYLDFPQKIESSGRIVWHKFTKSLNEVRLQPAHTPILVWKAILNKYAEAGQKILFTHTGSGSCRISAYDMGSHYVGCENNKRNWQRQERRFSDYIIQPDAFRGY